VLKGRKTRRLQLATLIALAVLADLKVAVGQVKSSDRDASDYSAVIDEVLPVPHPLGIGINAQRISAYPTNTDWIVTVRVLPKKWREYSIQISGKTNGSLEAEFVRARDTSFREQISRLPLSKSNSIKTVAAQMKTEKRHITVENCTNLPKLAVSLSQMRDPMQSGDFDFEHAGVVYQYRSVAHTGPTVGYEFGRSTDRDGKALIDWIMQFQSSCKAAIENSE
jgi:hypothetical protein